MAIKFKDQTQAFQDVILDRTIGHLDAAIRLGITKNSVIGFRHRLKLAAMSEEDLREYRYKLDRKVRHGSGRAPTAMKKERLPLGARYKPAPVAVADLEAHQCRYIFGDGQKEGIAFCTTKRQTGSHYCRRHADMCSEPYIRKRNPKPFEYSGPVPVRVSP